LIHHQRVLPPGGSERLHDVADLGPPHVAQVECVDLLLRRHDLLHGHFLAVDPLSGGDLHRPLPQHVASREHPHHLVVGRGDQQQPNSCVRHLVQRRVGALFGLDGDDLYPPKIGHHLERGTVERHARAFIMLPMRSGCSKRVGGDSCKLDAHLDAPCEVFYRATA